MIGDDRERRGGKPAPWRGGEGVSRRREFLAALDGERAYLVAEDGSPIVMTSEMPRPVFADWVWTGGEAAGSRGSWVPREVPLRPHDAPMPEEEFGSLEEILGYDPDTSPVTSDGFEGEEPKEFVGALFEGRTQVRSAGGKWYPCDPKTGQPQPDFGSGSGRRPRFEGWIYSVSEQQYLRLKD